MARRRKIYEGKAKVLFEGPEPGTLVQYFKDDATAFNNKKKGVITGKGVLNNRISEYLMTRLAEIGIPTHFVRRLNMREQLVREVEIVPIEVVVRNVAAGSFCERFGMTEGASLPRSIIEYYYKSDELGDPLITEEHITAFGWATPPELDDMMSLSLRVNDFLSGLFLGVGVRLVDFKLEFGRLYYEDQVRIVLADEISPDCCRLWDIETNEKLDKDRFRRDLGGVAEAYQEVARRLGILPEAGPRDLKGPATMQYPNAGESARPHHPQARSARPAGQGDRACARRARLRRRGRCAPRQIHRAGDRGRRPRGGARGGRAHVPAAPRQYGDRELRRGDRRLSRLRRARPAHTLPPQQHPAEERTPGDCRRHRLPRFQQ